MSIPPIKKKVEQQINQILADAGIEGQAEVNINQMAMTDVPKDDHLTQVYLARAEYEAKEIEENYLCFVCGKKYNHPDDFSQCMQNHINSFLAGTPIKREPEHIERILSSIPQAHRESARKILEKENDRS